MSVANDSSGTEAAAGARSDRRRALGEALLVGLVAMVAVGAGIAGLWYTADHTVRDNYRHYLVGLAQAAAQQVDPALHAGLTTPESIDTPDYLRAVGPLRRLRDAVPDIKYVYTVVRDGETVRFVLDAAEPGDADQDGVEDRAGVWEAYEDADPPMLAALGMSGAQPEPGATEEPSTDKWGAFMTGYAPLYDAAGRPYAAVGVDVDASVYLARVIEARNETLLGLVPATGILLGLSVLFYRVRRRDLGAARERARAALESERSAAVLALERSRLRNVIEGTGVGTWEWDVATGEVAINDQWALMLGCTPAELGPVTVDTWRALLHPQDVALVMEHLTASFGGQSSLYELDFRMRHHDGHFVWIRARGNVIQRDGAGRPLRMAGTHQDVTARKESDLALSSSEARFRGLFQFSPIGIALNDFTTGQFLEVNDALLAPTGYRREEFLGLSYWDVTPLAYSAQEQEQLRIMEETGRYGPYEKEYIRKDGSRYPVVLSGMRMVDASGRQVIWSIVQDISQRKALESELTEAARCDKLTGLANRSLLMKRLQRAIDRVRAGHQERMAVLFLDFDHFKLINDTLGHEAGDELLRQIAVRLRTTLRATDAMSDEEGGNLVARFGGDEFVVLINDLHDGAAAGRVAERLLNALAPSYTIAGRELHSSASIGIVTSEQGLESAEAVIRNADVAMYEAKRSGRACSVIFNEAMHTRLTRHVTVESGLRKALGTAELTLVYQPIVDLESGRMVSAEALLRWQHPVLGTISPAEFIPIAEDSGLIVPLGDWVLQEACRQLVEWRRAAPGLAPDFVSVNVSRAELALGPRLLRRVREVLVRTGLPPRCLQLEVTEREVMRDSDAAHDLMHQLRGIGVRLAMDDFGTGTSSLGCLKDYPFDTIKIDRSFVSDLAANRDVLAVIHATITLVENLGMASVAEGVETPAQVAILQSLGCRYAQGYHFARPVPPGELLHALEMQRAAAEEPVRG